MKLGGKRRTLQAETLARQRRALVLPGGGARAAYQVGVLKAVAEFLPAQSRHPFPIICGTSAGAINALFLAAGDGSFRERIEQLEQLWRGLTPEKVFRNTLGSLLLSLTRLGFSLLNQGSGRHHPLALLDNSPLVQLLEESIDFERLHGAVDQGDLDAVAVTTAGYTSGCSVSFFEAAGHQPGWRRNRRLGIATRLELKHLLASAALPTLFPAVRIQREYFGDGALRQTAPLSPALHLGADRILVIGVSGNRNPQEWQRRFKTRHTPSMAQIMGQLFSTAFIDALESDLENLQRINQLLALVPPEERSSQGLPLRPVDSLIVSPSEALDRIAGRKIPYLQGSQRRLLRSVGATRSGGGANLASYLLFFPPFCGTLIDLGYRDALWERQALEAFLAEADPEVSS